VITLVATTPNAVSGRLQAWQRTSGGAWAPYGPPILARVGNQGFTRQEHDALAATPIGSFTLTEAFGRLPNPGTHLPYFQTTPDDWWVSEPGPLYNTHQRCAANCPFRRGSPNAQLYFVRPQYDLAVVIDFNRGPITPGAGSGIFLHVTVGRPTNGCVSIPQESLVPIMRWLDPTKHPRILIGVAQGTT
jgi:L,D-peptidoglycan transpeptidase YkuD (ErfK/YbiS/YcfS/YnhG family)